MHLDETRLVIWKIVSLGDLYRYEAHFLGPGVEIPLAATSNEGEGAG